jgi:hypothetical protein
VELTATKQTPARAIVHAAGARRRRPGRLTAWQRFAAFLSCVLAAVIIGAVTLATHGDPASVLAALCLVPLLTTPHVMPPKDRRGGGGS